MDTLISEVIGGLTLVLLVAALFAALARRCGQPAVVGQIVAGLVLGPSVLGRVPGHPISRLLPAASIPTLTVLAQIAVALFMFAVGYELDLRTLRQRRRAPVAVAVSALLVPMALGCLTVVLFRRWFVALGRTDFNAGYVLYLGIAMSITALPVLAAILRERGIAGTSVGVTATAAAGIMDVVAWLVLAAVLVGATHQAGRPWIVTLALLLGFLAVLRFAVRPALRWWMRRRAAVLSNKLLTAVVLALGSAWATASLGLHPIFGAFAAGLIMPRENGVPDPEVLRPVEDLSALLLPLFFTVTGLSLNIESMNGAAFFVLALVLIVSVGGKLCSAYTASRLSGLRPDEAAQIAALVNTRGLTELIALNIGLSAGLIGPRLFAALVIMALFTTLMTAPLLTAVRARCATPTGESVVLKAPDVSARTSRGFGR